MEREHEKVNCFAHRGNECKILNEFVCLKRECPFYKTTIQFIEDYKKAFGEEGLSDICHASLKPKYGED